MKAISLLFLVLGCASQQKEDPSKVIERPLLGKHPGIRECYTNSSSYIKNPDAEVMMKVEFEVEKSGTTTGHKMLASSVPEEKFQKCVVENLRSLKYPPQDEPFIVEQSFTLRPGRK